MAKSQTLMTSDPIIHCESLVKIYTISGIEVQALQGLDLTVASGEFLGIVGASGSGKSTLMNILGGLDRPTAGRVWVNGNDLLKMNDRSLDHYRRSVVGFVWQQGTRNLIPYLTAEENIRLPMTLAGTTGKKANARVDMLLKAVELEERRHHYLTQLSGGEQQRVAIAIALINQPKLLLADEPTGEVDTATAQIVFDSFRSLNREFGLTTVIVSHDLGIARQVDRVVAVRDGKLATETVRRVSAQTPDDENGVNHGDLVEGFEELVILDSAGRLQVPKEYLHQFNIKRRARLELTSDGILIRPSANDIHPPSSKLHHDPSDLDRSEGAPSRDSTLPQLRGAFRRSKLHHLWDRWRSRDSGRHS
jgi:putative ABC transport system ATP-binding protein